jgi:hypothetical protein
MGHTVHSFVSDITLKMQPVVVLGSEYINIKMGGNRLIYSAHKAFFALK